MSYTVLSFGTSMNYLPLDIKQTTIIQYNHRVQSNVICLNCLNLIMSEIDIEII